MGRIRVDNVLPTRSPAGMPTWEVRPVSWEVRPVTSRERPVSWEARPVTSRERPVSWEARLVTSRERPVSLILPRSGGQSDYAFIAIICPFNSNSIGLT